MTNYCIDPINLSLSLSIDWCTTFHRPDGLLHKIRCLVLAKRERICRLESFLRPNYYLQDQPQGVKKPFTTTVPRSYPRLLMSRFVTPEIGNEGCKRQKGRY